MTSEKALQQLVESNLDTVFKCRLVATEFSTGAQHAGRIDSLALSEDSNPVIIEYKVTESSDLVNQSLFYLAWIHDHRGDCQVAKCAPIPSSNSSRTRAAPIPPCCGSHTVVMERFARATKSSLGCGARAW